MTGVWYQPDQLFDGARITSEAVCVADGVVTAKGLAPTGAVSLSGLLTPGFVDLQVNGGGGVLINTTPTADGMRDVAAAHAALGTVAIMPTVITDAPEVLEAAVDAVLQVKDDPRIAGLHIEGPHLSQARRGTHAAEHIRPMSERTQVLVQRLRDAGVPVMITVAPEAISLSEIGALAATGAVVSLGHTDATAHDTRAALEAGASCFTHLYNAMSPMQNRAPGVTGAAIASDAHAGIICDGIHVDDAMIGIAVRARPIADRMFLVSDAMPTVGGPETFTLYGQDIRVVDGRLINEEGSLAGAHVTQVEGVARLVSRVGLDAEEALRMAITTPAKLINRPEYASIIGRRVDDLCLLDSKMGIVGRGEMLSAPRRAS